MTPTPSFASRVEELRACIDRLDHLLPAENGGGRALGAELVLVRQAVERLAAAGAGRAATAQNVEAERQRYQELFDLAPDGYLVTDRMGVIREANGAASRLFGVRRDFLRNKPVVAFVVPEERMRFRESLADLEDSVTEEWEFRICPRDRDPVDGWIRVASSGGRGRSGKVRWLIRDVSERKRADAEIHQLAFDLEERVSHRTAELEDANLAKEALLGREQEARALAERFLEDARLADQRKDQFLAMLAHELRNPLAPIVNALRIIEIEAPAKGTVRRAREIAQRQVHHLVRMVDDLLDVSRVQRGLVVLRKEPVDLTALVRRTCEAERPVIEGRGLAFDCSTPDEPLWVEGDGTRIDQVLMNLLTNAAKFTPPPGRIVVTLARDGDWAILHVSDTGIGIAAELLPTIFEPFTQADRTLARSAGGLGLGLTLVRRLVEMHGGGVGGFSSGQNQGSEFVVRLPLRDRPAAPEAAPAAEAGGELAHGLVLVVDDNVDAADSTVAILKTWGYDARALYDGQTALREAAAHPPRAILLDIGLPGLDGVEVCRRLRADEALAATAILAVTGYGPGQAPRGPFDAVLTKPVALDDLRRRLARELESRAAPRA